MTMNNRLLEIHDWREKAQAAGYHAGRLARLCGVSLSTLEHFFRQYIGQSPRVWLAYVRLQRVFELLAQNLQLKRISFETGFTDPSNLSRFFKGCSGVSLSRFHNLPLRGKISEI